MRRPAPSRPLCAAGQTPALRRLATRCLMQPSIYQRTQSNGYSETQRYPPDVVLDVSLGLRAIAGPKPRFGHKPGAAADGERRPEAQGIHLEGASREDENLEGCWRRQQRHDEDGDKVVALQPALRGARFVRG